jgi:hypothetical protein
MKIKIHLGLGLRRVEEGEAIVFPSPPQVQSKIYPVIGEDYT